MAAFPLFDSNSVPLKDIFTDMPPTLRIVMTRGFRVMAALPSEKCLALAREIGVTALNASDTDIEKFANKLGLDEDSASAVLTSSSLLVALATSRNESSEALVQELTDASLVLQGSNGQILQVLQSLNSEKDQLKRSLRLENLASATFPAFKALKTSVDVRLEIKDGGVSLFTPILVAHLQTDHSESNVFFQMSKTDLERMSEQLAAALKQLSVAESWSKGRTA